RPRSEPPDLGLLARALAEAEDVAAHVVAEDVDALEARELLAAVDEAARHGGAVVAAVVPDGHDDLVGALLRLLVEGVRALVELPALVRPLLDLADHLPAVLPDVADPESALRVEREAPRVAHAVSEHLGLGALRLHERVVLRDRVG